jgi:hypothetical protein
MCRHHFQFPLLLILPLPTSLDNEVGHDRHTGLRDARRQYAAATSRGRVGLITQDQHSLWLSILNRRHAVIYKVHGPWAQLGFAVLDKMTLLPASDAWPIL